MLFNLTGCVSKKQLVTYILLALDSLHQTFTADGALITVILDGFVRLGETDQMIFADVKYLKTVILMVVKLDDVDFFSAGTSREVKFFSYDRGNIFPNNNLTLLFVVRISLFLVDST